VNTVTLGRVNTVEIRNASRTERWTDEYAVLPPRNLVARGAEVTFTNTSSLPHTLVARDGSWTSGTIDPGASRTVALRDAGTYEYVCKEHPWMMGQIVVE
jgi:plastocyanin